MKKLVLISLDGSGQLVFDHNPLVVSNGDEIRWTSKEGDITVDYPGGLAGGTAGKRAALMRNITSPAVVVNSVDAWYDYEVSLSKAGTAVNALPHVIVT